MSRTAASRTPIPRFDKASDDRAPVELWDEFIGRPDLILFESWCVGAVPQSSVDLAAPVNNLEVTEDLAGIWRGYVNRQLGEDYRRLFDPLKLLLMLKVPSWEMVYRWRRKQEEQLAAKWSGRGVMDEIALRQFIMHYKRLMRYPLAEMP